MRKFLMSWEQDKRRWVKMYKGVRYRISCEELNAPLFTKEASYKLANQWWERKLAELEKPSPVEERLMRWEAQDLLERERKAKNELDAIFRLRRAKGISAGFPMILECPPDAPSEDDLFNDTIRQERIILASDTLQGKATQTDRTIKHQAQRFLDLEKARNKAPSTFLQVRHFLSKMQTFPQLGEQVDVATISQRTMTDFYAWLRNGKLAVHSQKEAWNIAKRFVRFLWGEGLIELPRQLDGRQFTFDGHAVAVKVYPLDQVRDTLNGFTERLRLYALLALNTGALDVDMALLRHDELRDGRIIRKRSKTKNVSDNVPTVSYVLWPETKAMLAKYPSQHDEFVLTSSTGTPLWRYETGTDQDGKEKPVLVNLIYQQWKRQKIKLPLKALRSVASNLIRNSTDTNLVRTTGRNEYAGVADLFLGHAPQSMGERHYYGAQQSLLDEALTWLRLQFF